MNNKNRSILLQVGAKIAADQGVFNVEQIVSNYEILVKAMTTVGIDVDYQAPSSGGRGKPSGPQAPTFLHNGEVWEDFRALKVSGGVKPGFPDFRPQGGGFGSGEYLLDRDGAPKPSTAAIAASADAGLAVEVL